MEGPRVSGGARVTGPPGDSFPLADHGLGMMSSTKPICPSFLRDRTRNAETTPEPRYQHRDFCTAMINDYVQRVNGFPEVHSGGPGYTEPRSAEWGLDPKLMPILRTE